MERLPELTDILLTRDQSVVFATLNRPKAKNALNTAMVEGLITLCDWLQENRDLRALVLRGSSGAFCAGGDIKEFGKQLMMPEPESDSEDPVANGNRVFGNLLLKLDALPQIFVTVVEGVAFGGANGFISVSDVSIAEENTRFSLSETTLGVPPAQIGPFLVRRVGVYNARRLALTGAHFNATDALRIGHVDRVAHGAADLEAALYETLNAAGRCEPEANAVTKDILNRSANPIDSAQLDLAAKEFAACLRGKGREGAAAFASKTAPVWVETYLAKKEA
ncbi:enoyl-CoA hydratase/isomerase family protein [Hyphococcus flavus]|uniref:Enoyl-CoA hydratase/isomerase family protein n=1 Tax=Hyphococcus flavus TaxID=1866326 RepID=A0AAE9ZFC2_9PROT|nr:enoyl-CoA hydratase/isomerase family protein [Hyphococcus flavus]WDI31697.1 enoyl-CoA hydratase/isomerase family protein [Hyphococcus flavus]